MKGLVAGIFLGTIIGGVVGTVASDEIYDMKRKMFKTSKKLMKKCGW